MDRFKKAIGVGGKKTSSSKKSNEETKKVKKIVPVVAEKKSPSVEKGTTAKSQAVEKSPKSKKSFFKRFFKPKSPKRKLPVGVTPGASQGDIQSAEILNFEQRPDFHITSSDMRLMNLLAIQEEELQELHILLKEKKEEFRELDSQFSYQDAFAMKKGSVFVVMPPDEIENQLKKYKTELRIAIKDLGDKITTVKTNVVEMKKSIAEKFQNFSANRTPVAIIYDLQ